jgi:hypothetical protein
MITLIKYLFKTFISNFEICLHFWVWEWLWGYILSGRFWFLNDFWSFNWFYCFVLSIHLCIFLDCFVLLVVSHQFFLTLFFFIVNVLVYSFLLICILLLIFWFAPTNLLVYFCWPTSLFLSTYSHCFANLL